MADQRQPHTARARHFDDVFNTAMAPAGARDRAASANSHQAVIFGTQVLTVAVQQVGAGRVRDDALFRFETARAAGVRRITAPQFMIRTKYKGSRSVLDAIPETWRRVEHFERLSTPLEEIFVRVATEQAVEAT